MYKDKRENCGFLQRSCRKLFIWIFKNEFFSRGEGMKFQRKKIITLIKEGLLLSLGFYWVDHILDCYLEDYIAIWTIWSHFFFCLFRNYMLYKDWDQLVVMHKRDKNSLNVPESEQTENGWMNTENLTNASVSEDTALSVNCG